MISEDEWPLVLSLLPVDLEKTAKETGALERRRVVKTAPDLLRLVMAYSLRGLSLRRVSAWSESADVVSLSDVAVLKRLKKCGDWLNLLLSETLKHRVTVPKLGFDRLHLRLVDATCVSRPGSRGTDFRVHLGFDLQRMCIDEVQLTGPEGGETLSRFSVRYGDVMMGDRAYGERKAIAGVVEAGGDVLVRISWQNMPLESDDGSAFDILAHARTVKGAMPGDWPVKITATTKEGPVTVSGRLVVLRKSPQACERERRKVRKRYSKKGRTPDERTVEACDYILLFTTLSAEKLTAADVLALYRFRWQIELAFKRLKGILKLDEMRACNDELCRTFILGKMLAALLAEELINGEGDAFSPWGYGPPSPVAHQSIPGRGGYADAGSMCCM